MGNFTKSKKIALLESLNVLLEMAKQGVLTLRDNIILDETIELIMIDEGDDVLTEKRMSAEALLKARRYRLKKRSQLARIAKKKQICMDRAKASGRNMYGFACGSDGTIHKVNKSRSKAARIGARSRI